MKKKLERESNAGFHFYTTYQSCPRRFYFYALLKWESEKIHPALLFGQSIHHAIAEFYLKALDIFETFRDCMKERKELYEDEESYQKDLKRGINLLDVWMQNWGLDWKEREEAIGIELPFTVKIGDFDFTGRFDGVFKDKKTGRYFIREIKTTSYSVTGMYNNVYNADQVTAYIYAWNKLNPHKYIDEVQVDILYNKGNVYKAERPPNIFRGKRDLAEFEVGMYGIISEISQKVKNLKDFPAIQLFPRRGNCDGDGFYTCPYRAICRTDIDVNKVPFKFKKRED